MKNSENIRKLLHSMSDFCVAYDNLKLEIASYEQETGDSVNDLPGFVDSYPFDKSFDELAVKHWVDHTNERILQSDFTVFDYEYLNTGGNCMVGIFTVWLPERKQTVYALTNEEGCTLSAVDYIRNCFDVDDYDEVIIDYIDWGRATGHEIYFELYRHCLNEYTKSDSRHFGYVRGLPYHLLSDELQSKVPAGYREWCETENGCLIDTDGEKIIVSEYYESTTADDRLIAAVKEFQRWHDSIGADERYYNCDYTLTLADKKIMLPFVADVWDAVDHMLESIIKNY